MKRIIDLVCSSFGLVMLFPLLLFISIAVRVSIGAPIFFRQQRPGRKGRPFEMIKFRTMNSKKDEQGTLLPDEIRLTVLGAVLRKTSLDELPELVNVLRGDMSLVGPRPLLMSYLDRYSEKQMHRHDVRPGITGWAQVNGRNAISWEDKFEFDVWYVENQSILLDFKILFSTLFNVIQQTDISQEGHATMPEFMGTIKKVKL